MTNNQRKFADEYLIDCNATRAYKAAYPKIKSDEVVKIISNGGFSSIAFIKMVADKAGIINLHASTLAIGKKHIMALDAMHTERKLKDCSFIVGTIMKEGNQDYGYYGQLDRICNKNNWKLIAAKNHSKILLFDTTKGKYVLETSSNLNENPKMEQFSFEKSEELYDYYKTNFFDVIIEGAGNG